MVLAGKALKTEPTSPSGGGAVELANGKLETPDRALARVELCDAEMVSSDTSFETDCLRGIITFEVEVAQPPVDPLLLRETDKPSSKAASSSSGLVCSFTLALGAVVRRPAPESPPEYCRLASVLSGRTTPH